MCEHLVELENEILSQGVKETYRGQAWGDGTREWVYFDCYLNIVKLQKRFDFPDFVKHHKNDDVKSGTEEGFVCELCKDAVMGLNIKFKKNDDKKPIIS